MTDEEKQVDLETLWRYEQLIRLGLSSRDALQFAEDYQGIDLVHKFADLVHAGCPPELAKQILE